MGALAASGWTSSSGIGSSTSGCLWWGSFWGRHIQLTQATLQAQLPALLNGSGSPLSSMESVNEVAGLVMGLVCFPVPSFILGSAVPGHHVDTGVSSGGLNVADH